MSTLDLNKTIGLLQSNKIKERNDALNYLDTITVSKFRLNSKQFKLLTHAILKLIDHESQIHINNKSSTVDSRLSQASYYLRLLTEKSIDDTRIDLKYRTYLELCLSIQDQFYIGDDEILQPCAIDFIKTLSSILNLNYVKEHLDKKDWTNLFNFLMGLINHILDESNTSISITGSSEKLLIESFSTLQYLLQCDTDVSVNYLQLYDNENYFKLLKILDKTSELIKKENIIIIIIFKIINKLIVTVSTENFKFINKLIKIGIRLMVFFHQSHWEKLQDQFLIFINLPGTHDFMSLHHLPRLIGDRYILGENDFDDSNDSITSQTEDQDEVFLYSLGVLIQRFLSKLISGGEFELKPDDIGISAINTNPTWFNMKSIYLKTDTYKPWLLILGVSKLIKSYYDLKQFIQKQSDEPQGSLLLYSTGSSNKNKRQKLGNIAESITNSNSAIEFCNKLIHSKESSETQLLGLKLLLFFLEVYSFSKSKTESEKDDSLEPSYGDNTTFDFTVTTTDNVTFDKNVVLKNILKTFDDNSMNFWSMLSARSIVTDSISQIGSSRVRSSYASQLLKLSLLLVKEQEVSSIACNVIYKLVFERQENLSKLIDDSVLIQLETLIDLSEINGPYRITEESFQFWYAMHKLAIDVNLSKKNLLTRRIQDWILTKWDITFKPDTAFVDISTSIADFVSWLSGNQVIYTPPIITQLSYDGDLNEFYYFAENYSPLESFLCLKPPSEVIEEPSIEINSVVTNEKIDMILNKINISFKVFDNNLVSGANLLRWIMVLVSFVSKLRTSTSYKHEINALEYQALSGLESFVDTSLGNDEIVEVMKIFNQYLPKDKDIRRTFTHKFPSEKLINILKREERTDLNVNRRSFTEDGFGREFAQVRESSVPPVMSSNITVTYVKTQYKQITPIHVIKFILLNGEIQRKSISDKLTVILNYVENLSSDNLLPALLFIIDNVVVDLENKVLDDIPMVRMLRIIKEKVLSSQLYERNEMSLIVACRFLSVLAPTWINTLDNSISNDFYELAQWIHQCGTRDLMLTEYSFVEYCEFLTQLLIHNDEKVFSNNEIKVDLLSKYSKSHNNIKDKLSSSFVNLVSSSPTSVQGSLYNDLFEKFDNPEQSVELAGTYTKFFTDLSHGSFQILRLALFNLLECSRFPFFIPYLEASLQIFCKIMNLETRNNLFKLFKYEILRNWWKYDSIEAFPFMLFTYTDLQSFYRDNYRELIAITLSTKTENMKSRSDFVDQLAALKQSDVKTIVAESVYLVFPLAFTADGIRGDVSDILAKYFEQKLKTEMMDKLSLIVLQIIKFADLTNESAIISNYPDNEVALMLISHSASSSVSVEYNGELVITFDTAAHLLKRVVQKYYTQPEDYWSSKMIYFLLRRLSIVLNSATTPEQQILYLRKIKFVLALGGMKSIDYEVSRLLVTSLCPLMESPKLATDIISILQLLKGLYQHRYPSERSLALVSQITNALLSNKTIKDNDALLDRLEEFINMGDSNRAINKILTAGVELLRGEHVSLSSSVVELCLQDDITQNYTDPISLVSRIFDKVTTMDHVGGNVDVVDKLLNLEEGRLQNFSNGFKLWIANYLSSFYINGGCKNDIKAFEIEEYEGIPVRDFEDGVTYFDYTLDKIINYIYTDDIEAAACAESILGVLIRKYEADPRDVGRVSSFQNIYDKYSSNILPIDFHTCVLLNDKADVEYLGDDLSSILDNFESFLRADTELWCTKLYLAILQELAVYTTIAPLLTTFVIKTPKFAKTSLPALVGNYLVLSRRSGEQKIVALLNEFLQIPDKDESSIKIFLQILILIRIGAKSSNKKCFENVFDKVDKLQFYQLASKVKLFKTAVMLFEDSVSEESPKKALEDNYTTLQKVYESLDDEDLIFGLPEKTTMDYAISMINRLGNSTEQLRFSSAKFDTNTILNNQPSYQGIVSSLSKAGLLGVSRALSKNANIFSDTNTTEEDEQYEWSWKLSKWDLPVSHKARNENEVIYKTLKQIHDYPFNSQAICQASLLNTIDQKISSKKLSVKEFKLERLTWLKSIATVVSISEIANATPQELPKITNQFSNSTEWFKDVEFNVFENLLLARQATFQLLSEVPICNLSQDSIWLGALGDLVRYNNLARMNGEQQKMVTSTMLIEEISKKFRPSSSSSSGDDTLSANIHNLSSFQVAQTLWSQGSTSVPVLMMQELFESGGVSIPQEKLVVDRCLIRAMTVEWMSKSRQDLATNIMEKYVEPTAELAISLNQDSQQQSKVFEILAKFCEEQSKAKSLSEQIAKLEKRVRDKVKEVAELKDHFRNMVVSEKEKEKIQIYHKKIKDQLIAENNDLDSVKENKKVFEAKAVEFYLKSLTIGDFQEENLDKFLALWLEQSKNQVLNEKLAEELLALPSYKLISWCAQLISRLANDATEFQKIVAQLIYNMCSDHPYHSLYLLFSLRNHKSKAEESSNELFQGKCVAAENIWKKLLEKDEHYVNDILLPIDQFAKECINLGKIKTQRGKPIDLGKYTFGKYWLQELPHIPPPAMTLPVDPTKQYKNIPVLSKTERKVSVATSGLSLPKIVTFLLSDGHEHKALMKYGSDDLRQDSIMEQVFNKVNNIFAKDRECSKRDLRIRTYNAIPLGPVAGIIEFVPNSIPFIDAVNRYHQLYDTMRLDEAKAIMKHCQSESKQKRLSEFMKIEKGIKPVLRYFFQENFLTPDFWFQSRIKYTHGIATSSIVGYMLGLGDRHCNNILLDKSTGEPIHIDLGVAFDQGKLLPVPETVPFRLTRDVVDGFGVTGVEGVFKKSCEHTFRVLRTNKEHILSILDVLRWDPLYSWSLSPIKKKRLQQDETGLGIQPQDEGSVAGTAIRIVTEKLNANGLSTEAAVRELIQEATSTQNLAMIYLGWSPYY
ncbi:TEL1 Serine/threonine-protein kinase TEL1 [Candida maltosa Xu316]